MNYILLVMQMQSQVSLYGMSLFQVGSKSVHYSRWIDRGEILCTHVGDFLTLNECLILIVLIVSDVWFEVLKSVVSAPGSSKDCPCKLLPLQCKDTEFKFKFRNFFNHVCCHYLTLSTKYF